MRNPEAPRCPICDVRCRDKAALIDHLPDCEMGIRTSNIRPPIGTTAFDWAATLDSYDGAPDSGWQPVGYGPSRAAAVADLKQQIEEHDG